MKPITKAPPSQMANNEQGASIAWRINGFDVNWQRRTEFAPHSMDSVNLPVINLILISIKFLIF